MTPSAKRGILMIVSPQEVIAWQARDQIGQILREKGLTLEEPMESGREIRAEMKGGLKCLTKLRFASTSICRRTRL
jgi:hypothetical protein